MTQFIKDKAIYKMFPKAPPALLQDLDANINTWLSDSGCPSKENALIFLANVSEESAGLTVFEENLKYSAKRLMQVWPKRFPTMAVAAPYSFRPEKLASKVYANRMGNGDEASGDGWKFRGKGALQTTGKDNHAASGKELGCEAEIMADPELLLSTELLGPGLMAIYRILKLHKYSTVKTMTRAINGGYTNLEARVKYYNQIKGRNQLLSGEEDDLTNFDKLKAYRLEDFMADFAEHMA